MATFFGLYKTVKLCQKCQIETIFNIFYLTNSRKMSIVVLVSRLSNFPKRVMPKLISLKRRRIAEPCADLSNGINTTSKSTA